MRLMNIASGSAGNATYVGSDSTHILIDSGISRKRISEGLKRLGLCLKDLDAILITHEHSDHISSLGVLERTCEISVYSTPGTINGIITSGCLKGAHEMLNMIDGDSVFRIGDIDITALRTSHDANEPVCYKFSNNGVSSAVVTDLGTFDERLTENLKGLSALILEANHDTRMLEVGPYPYPLKVRVGGDRGHLSNESSGKLLSKLIHDDLKYIALGHISEKNNTEDLALLTVKTELDMLSSKYRSRDFRIDAAGQISGTEIYEF